jgi:hypothetical protein
MKILILSLALALAALSAFGQRKPKEVPVDPKDVQIDSLNKVTKYLALQLDSVSGELVKYLGLYNTIKEKVIHYSFDPTRSAYLIDSLAAKRDSTSALFALNQKTLVTSVDSIKVDTTVSNTSPFFPQDIETARVISGLKQLKELLDAKIITDAEFLILKKKYLDKL